MNKLHKTQQLTYKDVKHTQLDVDENTIVITEPFTGVTEDGSPIYYGRYDEDSTELLKVFLATKFNAGTRHGGLETLSVNTNYSPRTKGRNDFCAASLFASKEPEKQKIINKHARQLSERYAKELPEKYAWHNEQIKQDGPSAILPDYIIGGTPFTSGIINKDSAASCHLDSKNLSGALSAMIVLKRATRGGYLVLPEYNTAFSMDNNTILMFDGGKIMHGVSPMKFLGEDSYRYSMVLYTQRDMRNCLPPEEELLRANLIKMSP